MEEKAKGLLQTTNSAIDWNLMDLADTVQSLTEVYEEDSDSDLDLRLELLERVRDCQQNLYLLFDRRDTLLNLLKGA